MAWLRLNPGAGPTRKAIAAGALLYSLWALVGTGSESLIWGVGLLLIAAWSLLILAWATAHWFILPHIDQWRVPIERQATQLLGQPVRIGAVQVTSSGCSSLLWRALRIFRSP